MVSSKKYCPTFCSNNTCPLYKHCMYKFPTFTERFDRVEFSVFCLHRFRHWKTVDGKTHCSAETCDAYLLIDTVRALQDNGYFPEECKEWFNKLSRR